MMVRQRGKERGENLRPGGGSKEPVERGRRGENTDMLFG